MSFSLRQLRRPRSKVPFLQSAVGGLRSEEAACSTSSFKLSQAEGEDRADNRTERTPPATLYPGHRPTGFIERSVLTIGSGMAALMDQRRGGIVAKHVLILLLLLTLVRKFLCIAHCCEDLMIKCSKLL